MYTWVFYRSRSGLYNIMPTIYFVAGMITGVLLGVGFSIFYLRWKVGQQLVGMQSQMENMMDLTEEMSQEDFIIDKKKEEEQ